jgi:hypothetical protein
MSNSASARRTHFSRHCEERSDEAIHSSFARRDELFRGACHRARVRATRWLAMTVFRLLKCESADVRSVPNCWSSSPAKAGDPVRRGVSDRTARLRHTGYSAFAEYDGWRLRVRHAGCRTGARLVGALPLPNAAADFPVSAASTSATICSSRSSLASLVRRSRPKITLKVALLER